MRCPRRGPASIVPTDVSGARPAWRAAAAAAFTGRSPVSHTTKARAAARAKRSRPASETRLASQISSGARPEPTPPPPSPASTPKPPPERESVSGGRDSSTDSTGSGRSNTRQRRSCASWSLSAAQTCAAVDAAVVAAALVSEALPPGVKPSVTSSQSTADQQRALRRCNAHTATTARSRQLETRGTACPARVCDGLPEAARLRSRVLAERPSDKMQATSGARGRRGAIAKATCNTR